MRLACFYDFEIGDRSDVGHTLSDQKSVSWLNRNPEARVSLRSR